MGSGQGHTYRGEEVLAVGEHIITSVSLHLLQGRREQWQTTLMFVGCDDPFLVNMQVCYHLSSISSVF